MTSGKRRGIDPLKGMLLALFAAASVAGCGFPGFFGEAEVVSADSGTRDLFPEEIIPFDSLDQPNFTCTGLAYDEVLDSFWIADYGELEPGGSRSPRLVRVDGSLSEAEGAIDIENLEDGGSLQGLAYDSASDSLWIASGDVLVNVQKNGDEVRRIGTDGICGSSANGLAYDKSSDTLWVLFYREKLVNMTKTGEVIREFDVDLKDQDQLVITDDGRLLASVGADYKGDENYIVEIDMDSGDVTVAYRAEESYAIEGIAAVDGRLYVANDGLYHDAAIKKSYIAVYQI